MRKAWIILALLPVICFCQAPSSEDKKVTVLLTNISLEEAITIINISYGVQISYSDDVVPAQTMINLRIEDETLPQALEKLLKPYALTYKIVSGRRYVLQKIKPAITQTLRGTIVDVVTRAPIPGATVTLQNVSPLTGVTSDDRGDFRLINIPVGRHSIIISCIGYDPRTITGLLLTSGKELVMSIALSEATTSMNEIVVTGLKNDGIPGDGVAVTSSRTFSIEESKRFAGSLGDPARMASNYAGVTSASDDNNSLVVRGNTPRGILWRIDGIEVPNPNHFATEGSSSGVISVISPNMVSGVDFLTGAFPAQYGNALSAVFDVGLRNGNNEKREHSFQMGLTGIEASTEGPFKQYGSSYLVDCRYSILSILNKLGADLNSAGQYKDYQDVSFKLNFPTKRGGSFSMFGIGGKSKSTKSDTTVIDNYISNIGVLGLTYRDMINEKTSIQSSLSFSGTLISNFREVSGLSAGTIGTEESYSKSYFRVLVSVRRKITNRYFIEGGAIVSQLRYNFFLKTINPNNSAYPVIVNFNERDNDRTFITQGFIYARQYFSSRVFGFYGFHYMRFSLTDDQSLEPRVGLRYQTSDNSSLSFAYGKHSRIENLQYYLARDHQAGGNEVQINKNLGFTRADHIVLSYDHALAKYHRLKIEAYYQQLYNAPVQTDPSMIYSTINEDTGFITDSLINKGKGRNYGLEVSLDRSFNNGFYYLFNGTAFNSSFAVNDQLYKNTAYDGNYSVHALFGKEFELNKNSFGINVKITQAGGKRYVPIDLQKSIQEKRQIHDWDKAFDEQLPSYFRSDIQLVYKVNRPKYSFECRLDIQNVTNHKNAAWYFYDPVDESVKLQRQVGIVPLLSCRIDF